MLISLLRRLLSLLLALTALFFLYKYGMGDIHTYNLTAKEDKKMEIDDLHLDKRFLSADALVALVQQRSEDLGEERERILLQALQLNPSSGRAASSLLSLYSEQKKDVESEEIAALASKLWPAHTYTRSRLADFWLKQDRLDLAVNEWNALLIRNPRLYKELFPILKNIIQDEQARVLMQQFIVQPPRWWNSFFGYLSRELELNDLRLVYKSRVASGVVVSESENNSFVNRLIKEGLSHEAHAEWFVELKQRQMLLGGLVYDGGFEGDIFNKGFSWKLSRSKNPKIKTDITYGIKGRKALHVVFRKKDPINFRHVSQSLLLEPGSYELSLRYRADTLKTTKGLVWRLRCSQLKGSPVITESEAIEGSHPWSTLKSSFNVPNGCGVQLLRLEAASRFRHDHFFSGSVWFDEINIRSKSNEE